MLSTPKALRLKKLAGFNLPMSVTVRHFFVGFEVLRVRVAGIILIVAVRTCMMKKR